MDETKLRKLIYKLKKEGKYTGWLPQKFLEWERLRDVWETVERTAEAVVERLHCQGDNDEVPDNETMN